MLDHELITRTLSTAMRTGGEFAEVFVEDKRSSSAVLDDGRVEELTSGRDRGAGIRVVVGDTTGFAHTADLSEAGLVAAAEAAASAARGGGGANAVVAVSPIDVDRSTAVRIPPEEVAKATKVGLLTLANEAARAGFGDLAGVGPLRRLPSPHPGCELRRAPGRGRPGPDSL